tara:strand:- start:905 stop:1963 length:1059 start_codon:yes stop_codon:yes gene_type:complete
MSDENQVDIEDTLQDEIVDDVEVGNEDNLEEAMAPAAKGKVDAKGMDGAKAADDTKAAIDKSEPAQAPVPKTKAGMINAMYKEMSKMKKDELMASYGKVMSMKMHKDKMDEGTDADGVFEDDLKALVDSEATLSEGFKDKAEIIFEAALKSKISEHVERMEENYAEEIAEETNRIHTELVEKVDGYLNYVVESWMEENKLAIESGLRTEISESFMKQLHTVFTEHYIEVPESKIDLVDELATQKDELEEQVNTTVADNVSLKAQVEKLERAAIVTEASTGLSEAQTEKLKGLVEDIDADDNEAYAEKVAQIKESYFKAKVTATEEETIAEDNDQEVEVSDSMSVYLAALNKK